MKIRRGPDGPHIFDRRTGINILFDELSCPRESWSLAPRQISVALTNACDLRCRYCYAPKRPANLSSRNVMKWLNELDDNGCLGVGFGGGEPTLHPAFVELCEYASKKTSMSVSFTTHGHHINEDLASKLQGHVHFIRVSVDGVNSTYETLRNRPFYKLVRQLQIVSTISPFGINFVVNRDTINDLDDTISLLIETGAQELLLLPEISNEGVLRIDDETKSHLIEWAKNFKSPIRLTVSENSRDGFSFSEPLPNDTGLRSYAHIDAMSVVKRSSFDKSGIGIDSKGILHALSKLNSNYRSE